MLIKITTTLKNMHLQISTHYSEVRNLYAIPYYWHDVDKRCTVKWAIPQWSTPGIISVA
jgi:hypothetical protein